MDSVLVHGLQLSVGKIKMDLSPLNLLDEADVLFGILPQLACQDKLLHVTTVSVSSPL